MRVCVDGLIDIDEVICGTDMNDPDTDDNLLTDGEEHYYCTNPLLTDTDGDGYSDYEEIGGGSDPLDENSIPPCEGDFDSDGDVDGLDLAAFADAFGSFLGDTNYNADADFDGNDAVDEGDLASLPVNGYHLGIINVVLRHVGQPPLLEEKQLYAYAGCARGPNFAAN